MSLYHENKVMALLFSVN